MPLLSIPIKFYKVEKGQRSGYLYTAAYRETRTAAVYNAKWRADRQRPVVKVIVREYVFFVFFKIQKTRLFTFF